MTSDRALVPALRAFLVKKRDDAEQSYKARVEEAASWRHGTDADHEAARKLAQRMSGRPLGKKSADERDWRARSFFFFVNVGRGARTREGGEANGRGEANGNCRP